MTQIAIVTLQTMPFFEIFKKATENKPRMGSLKAKIFTKLSFANTQYVVHLSKWSWRDQALRRADVSNSIQEPYTSKESSERVLSMQSSKEHWRNLGSFLFQLTLCFCFSFLFLFRIESLKWWQMSTKVFEIKWFILCAMGLQSKSSANRCQFRVCVNLTVFWSGNEKRKSYLLWKICGTILQRRFESGYERPWLLTDELEMSIFSEDWTLL